MRDVLEERGPRVVFLGRLAAFPSALMAAAAGASGVPWREFVVADTAGALAVDGRAARRRLRAGRGLRGGRPLGHRRSAPSCWPALLVVLGRALLRSGSGGTATRKA